MSSADRLGSGIGVSEVTAVKADTVLGNADAKDRTVARVAAVSSSLGGAASLGAGAAKKVGWLRSVKRIFDPIKSATSKSRIFTKTQTYRVLKCRRRRGSVR